MMLSSMGVLSSQQQQQQQQQELFDEPTKFWQTIEKCKDKNKYSCL
jgi:hypothetical protein